MSTTSRLLPFQPMSMTTAQLAVSFLARYSGHTHELCAYQLRRWFQWCEGNGLDPLVGIQRAHVELYIRGLGQAGLMVSSTNTMIHGIRGFFRFAHIDGLIPADPAIYARLPKVHSDESSTQGLDRLELIRFLLVAQTITVHHGALAYLLGINALRAAEAAAVRIEDYAQTMRGHRILHLVGKGDKPATIGRTRRQGRSDPPSHQPPTRFVRPRSPTHSTLASHSATPKSSPVTPTQEPPNPTTPPAATSTTTESTSSPPTSPGSNQGGHACLPGDAQSGSDDERAKDQA